MAGPRLDETAGRAHCSAGVLAAENGDYGAAVSHAERSLRIFSSLGRAERMALAATVLGSAHRYRGDTEAARRGFQTAMDLRLTLGDPREVSVALDNLALVEADDGNFSRATELYEDALAIKRQLGEQRSIAIGLLNLADVLMRTSQWDAADRVLAESVGLMPGNPQLTGKIRTNQGLLAVHRKDWARAAEHFRAAIGAAQSGGHPHDVIEAMIGLGRVYDRTGDQDEAIRQLRSARALATEIGNPGQHAAADAALAEVTQAGRLIGPGPAGASRAGARTLPAGLTSRQAEVLRLLAAGLSNKQIAAELFLSTATVERHLATIYLNFGLGGRVEAARFAMDNGLAQTSDHAAAPAGPAESGGPY